MVLANSSASGDFMRTQPWLRTPGTLLGALVPWMPKPNFGSPKRTNTGPKGLRGPGGTVFTPSPRSR